MDPHYQVPLFTPETKTAVDNCIEKAHYLQDPLPIDQMYDKILPNPNSKHGLVEYISKRGESKLEGYHDRTTHFGNSGMRNTLCDSLNLAGTCRWNMTIRHKRSLAVESSKTEENPSVTDRRKLISAAWESVPPYFNHTELGFVNAMAVSRGATKLPTANLR